MSTSNFLISFRVLINTIKSLINTIKSLNPRNLLQQLLSLEHVTDNHVQTPWRSSIHSLRDHVAFFM